ncbi:ABC transporter ATP-binding protein [Pelagibacteraceae bacterium]|nr:ABC transporter ATP-binding protein [Pelagibacteraceae bacterium]
MSKHYAVRLKNVSKVYSLHGSPRDQLINVFGLHRIGINPKTKTKKFVALNNINLEVPRGHRIGIIGRNGAGKSTMLKLLCGNFAPTHGEVEVNGEVQALMNIGLGFHPDYTGRENVEASLQYNGLNKSEYQEVLENIIDFCEMDEFFDQPFKTYSLGMQTRLMFASATAIRPDILIVDEVLGSGDAYFVAKSKSRVDNMIKSGCTMLLVSHSMQQVLELCDQAIWLDQGTIRMHDESFKVIKAYEEFMHQETISKNISVLNSKENLDLIQEPIINSEKNLKFDINDKEKIKVSSKLNNKVKKKFLFQEPLFIPHSESPKIEETTSNIGFSNVSEGGVSSWAKRDELKISGFLIANEDGKIDTVKFLSPLKMIFEIQAVKDGYYNCRYSILVKDALGLNKIKVRSPKDSFNLKIGEKRTISMLLNPNQLGPGNYSISLAIHQYTNIEEFPSAKIYDLLNRSFEFSVLLDDTLANMQAEFFHSAEWSFRENK